MSKRGFWNLFAQSTWTKEDWERWDKAGRPRVPISLGLSADAPVRPSLDQTPVVEPPHLFNGFDLYARPPRKGANARSRSVDTLLEKTLGHR